MPTSTTTETQLAQIHRRIDRLDLSARGAGEAAIGLRRRVTVLRRQEASARADVSEAAARVEQSVRRLDETVGLAEKRAVADVADDAEGFLDAVSSELHDWDVCLERLQLRAATAAGSGRRRAEAAIRELRRRRNALGESIADVRSAGEAWRERRGRIRAARDALERGVAETQARLDHEQAA
jgi:chromosome segregation ATPase